MVSESAALVDAGRVGRPQDRTRSSVVKLMLTTNRVLMNFSRKPAVQQDSHALLGLEVHEQDSV